MLSDRLWRCLLWSFVLLVLPVGSLGTEIPFPAALDQASLSYDGLQRIQQDALIIGNGDVAGLIYEEDGNVVLKASKNDVWDARLDAHLDPPLPRFERVKELGRSGKRFKKTGRHVLILEEGVTHTGTSSYKSPYPCPRPCAMVKLLAEETKPRWGADAKRPVHASLCLRRAAAKVEHVGPGDHIAEFSALANRNVFLIRTKMTARLIPPSTKFMKGATTRTGRTGDVDWFVQTIPGDLDWPGMSFAVAMKGQGGYFAVSVVSSLEAKDPRSAAIDLLAGDIKTETPEWITEHEAVWSRYWSASGINIDDPLFSKVWYQQLYFLRCAVKPGVISPGLYIGAATDPPLWHGDYHLNANLQGVYWPTLVTNHLDMMEPYHRFALEHLPRAKWLAKKVFDMDGAYYPLTAFAYEPAPEKCKAPNGRQYFHHEWGFIIGITSFVVQPLWWEYQFSRGRHVLEKIYPVIREVAIFQSEFIDRCPEGEGRAVLLGPSVSPEHRGWTPGLRQNYNGAFDIALFRLAFEAAIESATTLGRDPELVRRWKRSLRRLPPYPTSGGPEPVVLDMKDARPVAFNLAPQMTPVWPAGLVTWTSPDEVRLFTRTLEKMNWGKIVAWPWYCQYRVRLNTPDAFDWTHRVMDARYRPNGSFLCVPQEHPFNDMGYPVEMAQVAMVISEMLLQSVGDTIRVFPVWPKDRDAAFRDLRAQGGFIVSAEQNNGQVTRLEIMSTVGGPLRLQSPWPNIIARLPDGASRRLTPDARGVVGISTTRGQRLTFSSEPTP
jgi:hypothetical protein